MSDLQVDSEAMGFILKSVLSKPRNYFTNQETKNNAGSFLFGKLATLGLLTHSQPIDMEKMSSAFSEKVRKNSQLMLNSLTILKYFTLQRLFQFVPIFNSTFQFSPFQPPNPMKDQTI